MSTILEGDETGTLHLQPSCCRSRVRTGVTAWRRRPGHCGRSAGLYTAAQVQNLNPGVQLIQRNPANGQFTLQIGLEKSPHLNQPYLAFPMSGPAPTTVVNGQGKLDFQFTVPDNAAFFRLQSQ